MMSKIICLTILGIANICVSYGQFWTALETETDDAQFKAIDFYDDNNGIVVGREGVALQTSDGGLTWNPISLGVAHNMLAVDMVSESTAYISSTADLMYKTVDGGVSWTTLSTPGSSAPGIQFISSTTGFISCYDDSFYKTTDGGLTWIDISFAPTTFFRIQFLNESVGYALGCNDYLYKTTDGGDTWTSKSHGIDAPTCVKGMYFTNENTGYVAFDGKLSMTTDGAENWTITEPFSGSGVMMQGIYFRGAEGWAAPSNQLNTIHHTLDGGVTWTTSSVSGCGGFSDMQFPSVTTGYACSINNKVYKITYAVGIEEINNNSVNVYPLPSSGTVNLTGDIEKVEVYSSIGALILTKEISDDSPTIDLSDQPTGLYLFKIKTAKGWISKKAIIE